MVHNSPNKTDIGQDVAYGIINQKSRDKEYSLDQVPRIGYRHLQVLLCFLLLTFSSCIENSMSVAIVAMTDPSMNTNPDVPVYSDWTSKNIIFSSFYWLCAIFQLFSGTLVHKYGPKWFLIGSTTICSLLFISVPQTAAWWGSVGVMISRILQGATQSVNFPCVHHLLSQWAPAEERSTLGSLAYCGLNLGAVISLWCTGSMAGTSYGWPLIFYTYGGIGLLFALLGIFLICESPARCPNIIKAEKFYIENSLGHLDEKSHPKIPWIKILSSAPFWAMLLATCGDLFGTNTLINQIPSYMNYVLHFDIQNSSFLLALPYIALMGLTPVFSILSDYCVSRKFLSITASRKISNSLGLIAPALALLYMSFFKMTDPIHVLILLTIVVALNAAPTSSGWIVNHMDLSPNYADSMMGVTSGAANICVFISPLIAGYLVTDEVTACVYIAASVIYNLFGSGDLQPWNDEEDLSMEKDLPDGESQKSSEDRKGAFFEKLSGDINVLK